MHLQLNRLIDSFLCTYWLRVFSVSLLDSSSVWSLASASVLVAKSTGSVSKRTPDILESKKDESSFKTRLPHCTSSPPSWPWRMTWAASWTLSPRPWCGGRTPRSSPPARSAPPPSKHQVQLLPNHGLHTPPPPGRRPCPPPPRCSRCPRRGHESAIRAVDEPSRSFTVPEEGPF